MLVLMSCQVYDVVGVVGQTEQQQQRHFDAAVSHMSCRMHDIPTIPICKWQQQEFISCHFSSREQGPFGEGLFCFLLVVVNPTRAAVLFLG